jgi:capsular polysaccharide biosynthesis protein
MWVLELIVHLGLELIIGLTIGAIVGLTYVFIAEYLHDRD